MRPASPPCTSPQAWSEGDIIEIRKTAIQPLEASEELMARLAQLAAPLCADTVRSDRGCGRLRASRRITPARPTRPMLSKEESPIDWSTAREIHCRPRARGLVPWPVATAELGGAEFKIYRVDTMPIKKRRKPQVRSSR